MTPTTYQGPRAEDGSQLSMSQDARLAFEKAYSQTTVGKILEKKGFQIYSVTSSMTLAAAVTELSVRKIGNMPVIDPNDGLVGVLSERDIIAATAEFGEVAMNEPVSKFMTANPKTCSKSERVADVMQVMTDGHFRHMPVIEDGKLAGVISIRDIVMHRVQEVEYEYLRLKQLMVG